MKEEKVYEALRGYQKGSFVRVGYESQLGNAAAKQMGQVIKKVTEVTGRIGINYKNIASVKARKEQETSSERTYKVWFKHVEGHPELIEHLEDASKRYLQIFSTKNSYPKVKYYLNGEEISKEDLQATNLCTKSDLASSSKTEVYAIPLQNIIFIGGTR